jgi:hypothetical protein
MKTNYVAIIEEVVIHRVEFYTKDKDPESLAYFLFREGELFDADPYRDSIRVLEIREEDSE